MNHFFKNFSNSFKQYIAKPVTRYLSTPVGKITVFNTVLFVHIQTYRHYGMLKASLKVS